jgi:acyl-[acyl-carrier-protein] desaturase
VTATRAHREAVYRAYMEFFEKAERIRRWSVFHDLPWDELDPSKATDELALCAETFCGVEMYLPDYVAQGINVVRDRFGQAWFQANWGYEESKHAFALREWLVRSGKRTQEQWEDFEASVFKNTWNRPFGTARQMTCYGCIQEQATWMIYRKQKECADQAGDAVLAKIYSLVGRDEAAHGAFYRDVVALEMEEDRDGTLRDLAFVFANFEMPGVGLVPDYDSRIGVMRSAGIDRNTFLAKVWFPLLKSVGTSRAELSRSMRRMRDDATTDPEADPGIDDADSPDAASAR